jgi:hypothetical protein
MRRKQDVRFGLRLDPKLAEWVRRAALKSGEDASKLWREALREYLSARFADLEPDD